MFLYVEIFNTVLAFSCRSPAMAVRALLGRLVCQTFLDIEAIAKEMSQLIRSGVFIIPALAKNYITEKPRTKISQALYLK